MKKFLFALILTSILFANQGTLQSEPVASTSEMRAIFEQNYRDDAVIEELINKLAVFVLMKSEDAIAIDELIDAYKSYVHLPEGEERYLNILRSNLSEEECRKAYELIQNDLYMQYRSKIDSLNIAWHEATLEILTELTESITTEAKNTEKEVVKPKERRMQHVTSKNLQKLLNSTKPLIIDCYANWCVPCRMLSVIYKELNQEYGDVYRFTKLNVEEEEEIAKTFHVKGLPTLLFIKNGKEVGRHTGYVDKEELLEIIINSFKESSEEVEH